MSPGLVALVPGIVFQRRYRIVRAISAGGMGTVYEAVDGNIDAPCALKLMHPSLVEDADLRRRFAQEAKITGAIRSDHIVRVFDAGVDEATNAPFIVMELLHGKSLAHTLGERGAMSASEAIVYLRQTAWALEKTHAAGIVHRDLKPDNLLITRRDDGTPCVKVLDFGIAKAFGAGSRQTTQTMGTPVYMAPEQIRGDANVGPGADVYALGHIAYELLVGEAYFDEEHTASAAVYTFFTHVLVGRKESPVTRAERRRKIRLPSAFEAWFQRATAPEASARFPTAIAAVEALAAVFRLPQDASRTSSETLQSASLAVATSSTGGEPTTAVWRKEARGPRTLRIRRLKMMAAGIAVTAALVLLLVIVLSPAEATNGAPTAEISATAKGATTAAAAPSVTPAAPSETASATSSASPHVTSSAPSLTHPAPSVTATSTATATSTTKHTRHGLL